MATQVELEILGELGCGSGVTVGASLFHLFQRGVGTGDVGVVVLVVVQLHDLSRDVGLESSVVIREIGQRVLFSHCESSFLALGVDIST